MNSVSGDVELLAEISQGSKDAFRQFYGMYAGRVLAFLRSKTSDNGLVEDMLQEIFFAVWRGSGGFDPRLGSVEQWLFTLSRNKLFDSWRRIYRFRRMLEGKQEAVGSAPDSSGLDEHLSLLQTLRGLPDDQHQLLSMVYLQDRSLKDCSLALSLPLGTIKWRLHRAVKQLRAAWTA